MKVILFPLLQLVPPPVRCQLYTTILAMSLSYLLVFLLYIWQVSLPFSASREGVLQFHIAYWRTEQFGAPRLMSCQSPIYQALLNRKGNKFKKRQRQYNKKTYIDRHGSKPSSNIFHLPDLPHFSLLTTFHPFISIKKRLAESSTVGRACTKFNPYIQFSDRK